MLRFRNYFRPKWKYLHKTQQCLQKRIAQAVFVKLKQRGLAVEKFWASFVTFKKQLIEIVQCQFGHPARQFSQIGVTFENWNQSNSISR
jgi:hypothetical protein